MARARGAIFEERALSYLRRQGLRLVARNVGYRCGELDLVMRAADGTLVFVEVRARGSVNFGGALASVTGVKCARLIKAAHFFDALRRACACLPL